MKLGVINHVRCGENTYQRTLVWLPDEMTEEEFAAVVADAQREYLAFLAGFTNAPAPNDYRPHNPVPYRQFPDLTVAQVETAWAEKRAVWDAWDAERKQSLQTFGTYLAGKQGVKRFWEFDPPFVQECDWGHRHGVKLHFEATEFD